MLTKYVTANIPMQLVGIRQHPDQGSRSKLAYGEAVDIWSRRLMTDDYSRDKRSIIRSTLSRAHLYRAQFGETGNRFSERLKDLGRAALISPNTLIWNLCLVYLF